MRVVICDDHRVFAESLAVVVAGHGHEVTACTTKVEDAIQAVRDTEPELCMIDLSFPGGDALDAIRAIHEEAPETKVVVLSGYLDDDWVDRATRAGATWCFGKDRDVEEVVELAAHLDEIDEVGWPARGRAQEPVAPDPWSKHPLARFLTVREREVLEGLVRGESTTDLARSMGVSSATIRTHVQSMLCKLGVHSRLEAVSLAVSENLVPQSAFARRRYEQLT